MTKITKESVFEEIQKNINSHGYHLYVVAAGIVPRFAYTIGLKESAGADLIFAGGTYYLLDEMKCIFEKAIFELKNNSLSRINFTIEGLGAFSMHQVDTSWSERLMLGAMDFYSQGSLVAFQIFPDSLHYTLDTPDLSKPWSLSSEPAWKWIGSTWNESVPKNSTAVTNLSALQGGIVTEVVRWEDDQWEMFSGAGPDVLEHEIRVVPLTTLLALDPSLEIVIHLNVGDGLWRDSEEKEWHKWGN